MIDWNTPPLCPSRRVTLWRDTRGRVESRRSVSALLALSEAVENCDPYTRGHSARVARMAYEVGLRLDCDESELALLTLGGALHDVGKLGVRDEVLNKPGPLTADELREVRAHPEIGARMVALDRALRAGASRRPLPPRAMGRRRLPERTCRVRDPARRAHPRRRRQLRRDDVGPAVPSCAPGAPGRGGGRAVRRHAVRSGGRRGVSGRMGIRAFHAAGRVRATAGGRRRSGTESEPSSFRARSDPGAARRQSAAQTSSFVRTRRMTSSVNSLVPAWPPRSAVRTPSATVSRQASRIARPATAVLSV